MIPAVMLAGGVAALVWLRVRPAGPPRIPAWIPRPAYRCPGHRCNRVFANREERSQHFKKAHLS